MNKLRISLVGLLLFTLVLTSCKKETVIVESEVLAEYLESTESPLMKDYVNSDMPSIIAASEVKTLNETGQVYIIDIRSATDFASGHIKNAVNVAAGDILSHIQSVNMDDYSKVAVVCYFGQTAGWAASILRLMGYDKVYSMKWGMSSWNENFAGSWKNNIGNAYALQFTSEVTQKGPMGDLPDLNTGYENGQDILEARVDAVLTEGFGAAKISNTEVFGNLGNYYIINYWPENHYANPGHIPGAVQYTPRQSIKLDADLKTLPTDKTIVVYCYTGQTSAFLTAYLRILGYDAKSLLFGVNGMNYDGMVGAGISSVFSDSQIMGYTLE